MLSILCSTRPIADEALLGTAELGEGELERLMAATREYSEMRVKGKFGRGSGGVPSRMEGLVNVLIRYITNH